MQRRSFLSSIAALGVVPALPFDALGSTATKVVGYNRYMYGVGVFHARTSASVGVVDLAAKMAIPQSQAKIMIGEMMSRGVVSPLANSAGLVRAMDPVIKPKYTTKEMLEKAVDWLDEQDDEETTKLDETPLEVDVTHAELIENQEI